MARQKSDETLPVAGPGETLVRFVEDVQVRDHLGEVEVSFAEGDVQALGQASAERWVRRGKAVLVDLG